MRKAVGLNSDAGMGVNQLCCETCARWSFDPDAKTQCPWFFHACIEDEQNPWVHGKPPEGVPSASGIYCIKWVSREEQNERRREARRTVDRGAPLLEGLNSAD